MRMKLNATLLASLALQMGLYAQAPQSNIEVRVEGTPVYENTNDDPNQIRAEYSRPVIHRRDASVNGQRDDMREDQRYTIQIQENNQPGYQDYNQGYSQQRYQNSNQRYQQGYQTDYNQDYAQPKYPAQHGSQDYNQGYSQQRYQSYNQGYPQQRYQQGYQADYNQDYAQPRYSQDYNQGYYQDYNQQPRYRWHNVRTTYYQKDVNEPHSHPNMPAEYHGYYQDVPQGRVNYQQYEYRQDYYRPAQSDMRYTQYNTTYSNQPAPNRASQVRPMAADDLTLVLIKPDAVQGHHIGEIISRYEQSGLRIAALKMVRLNRQGAEQFYQEHRNRPFYPELVSFMSSGPVIALVLEGDNAVAKSREIIGATDPAKADKGTIRSDFAESVGKNAIHGSDSPESANREIFFFFRPNELYNQD
jgi:nucleoside-diphosphate kinase